jgi:predicted transcriptional regulator
MSVIELQNQIIDKIKKTDDIHLLEDLSRFIDFEQAVSTLNIPNSINEKIEKAIKQADAGEIISNEAANKEIDLWLEKSNGL